ncbi:hypothetical protein Hanom_Chr17g01538581 [Helianthus anomalus]
MVMEHVRQLRFRSAPSRPRRYSYYVISPSQTQILHFLVIDSAVFYFLGIIK